MFALTALRRHLARKHSTNFKCDKEGCNKTFAKQYQVWGYFNLGYKITFRKPVLRILNDLFQVRILTVHKSCSSLSESKFKSASRLDRETKQGPLKEFSKLLNEHNRVATRRLKLFLRFFCKETCELRSVISYDFFFNFAQLWSVFCYKGRIWSRVRNWIWSRIRNWIRSRIRNWIRFRIRPIGTDRRSSTRVKFWVRSLQWNITNSLMFFSLMPTWSSTYTDPATYAARISRGKFNFNLYWVLYLSRIIWFYFSLF